jgi:site-specific DNA-cytosine methylase
MLIVDGFAGGGGASSGIELALGVSPSIAINHDPEAIAMHAINHPETRHYGESILMVADQLAAIRNCPHAIAAMGRALAHGEREGGGAGSNRGQTAQDHAEHAMAHAAVAYARPEERDAVTGELDATHAMARWALVVEVSR